MQETLEARSRPASRERLAEVAGVFLKLGVIGFGGPTAHLALLETECVHKRRWVDRQHFLDAVAATNLVPGPNSTELAIHLGYLRAGRLGGVVAGALFILPAFLLMLVLSWAYARYGAVPEVGALFAGLKPAVLAIIGVTAWRLARTAVTDRRLAALYLAGAAAALLSGTAEIAVLVLAGLVGMWLYAPPPASTGGGGGAAAPPAPKDRSAGRLSAWLPLPWLVSGTPPLAPLAAVVLPGPALLAAVAWVFFKAGAFLFGGGYVMIPLLEPDVVGRYGWVTRQQFLDGVALGQATPGPIVITATFLGFLAARWAGAALATAAIFLPAFLFVLFGTGPFTERLRGSPQARAFLKGTSAAAAGAIGAAALALVRPALAGPVQVAIFLAALVALVRYRIDSLWIVGSAAALGVALRFVGVL